MLIDGLEDTERLVLRTSLLYYDYLLFWSIQMTDFVIIVDCFKYNTYVKLWANSKAYTITNYKNVISPKFCLYFRITNLCLSSRLPKRRSLVALAKTKGSFWISRRTSLQTARKRSERYFVHANYSWKMREVIQSSFFALLCRFEKRVFALHTYRLYIF